MKTIVPALLLLLLLPAALAAKVEVTALKVENMTDPLGLDTSRPRFSWQIVSEEHDVVQTGYRILVSSTLAKCQHDEGDLWDSGEVGSDQQLWVAYGGKPLGSNQHVYWKVRVSTNKGVSAWAAAPSHFSTGLLGETQWRGRWIGLEHLQAGEEAGVTHPRLAARYLRKEFRLRAPVRRATAFVSGLGLYRLYINGTPLAHDELTPLPSDYRRTVYYDTYDVTPQMESDTVAAVGIVLGNGRYFAMRQDKPYKNTTFGLPKCRLNIVVEYADGKTERLVTDETWRVSADGPIRDNNEYDGETYDARLELGPWTLPGYDDSRWQQAERTSVPTGTLRGRVAPGMKVHTVYRPVVRPLAPLPAPAGGNLPSGVADRKATYIVDFGQNLAGRVSLMPHGQRGDTIRLRYGERLSADGTLYTANLRDARSEDIYVCSGLEPRADQWDAARAWHATFVTHGFRYVEVTGLSTLETGSIVAEEIYDDMADSGTFDCGDSILNKVVASARRGIASNYKGLPVDCPQRNERQPWLGDRTVGALGESFLFDNERLYTKWMRDICEAQREDGCLPDVAPAYWNYYTDDVTWPAALPFICDMLWRQYGNDEALRQWYPNIRLWLHHILDSYTTKNGLLAKDKYGDWCVPPERLELIHSADPARKTDGTLIATAYTIGCMQLASQFARHLGLDAEAADWQQRWQAMADAFNRRFLTVNPGSSPRPGHPLYPDSTFYGNNTATANLLPLAFGICPDTLRAEVAKQVVENVVVRNKGHVACGVIGISWLMRALTASGYGDVAYALATEKTYPSWGYMTEQGATTIWELWNGDRADPSMNSGNHVMLLGDLLTWCYQHLGGIGQQPGSTAYRHTVLQPDFSIEGCDRANCHYTTPYGLLVSEWTKTPQHLDWHIVVPCNTTAEVHLPDGTVSTVGSGSYDFSATIPTGHAAIRRSEFLYEEAPFASPHASTLVETRQGDLVCAYFGGTYERNPDCRIWVSIKPKGSTRWEPPIVAATGAPDPSANLASETTEPPVAGQLPCWNPVLFEMPDGELWLFFKLGRRVADWTGWLTKSADGGRTWSAREPLPEGFLGPVKNKPILVDGRLLCGSSTETDGWRFHVELLDLATGQWQKVGPVASTVAQKTDDNQPHPIDCIQPSFLRLRDGRLQVLMRTHNARLAQSFSSDGGLTWSPVTLSDVENNQSGTDAVTLRDGSHVLVYNNFETLPLTKKGPRTPLSLAVSDDGQHWRHWLTLEDSPCGEYSYPAIVEGRDGTLHITYTWQRRRVAYKQVVPGGWPSLSQIGH